AGIMGAGIAQVAAQAKHRVWLFDAREGAARAAKEKLASTLEGLARKGKLTDDDARGTLARIEPIDASGPAASAKLVVEAIVEDLDAKRALLRELETIVAADCVLATNTSSISVTALANGLSRPQRLVGMHFFNPVPLMKLVEVVRTILTTDETFDAAFEFAKALGKEPVSCRDNSGFIVNRLLVPYILDAIRGYEEGIGSIEDIDKAMQLGCGYPMGPFTLLDFVGLDTTYYITHVMFDEYREKRFAAPPLLKKMVLAGRFGRKSGAGFYDYSSGTPVAFDKVK
ncbi:MAG: 3-hydroxybutyryl-CoA dehydrogenase, partial [Acidobacteria bacterium]|nr:3-hydroxybutyryl-CoA dehydrogenase [Acidobacteriota bacterium]